MITKVACQLARLSAHRPIHVIIFITLLASIAYLSIVDEYVQPQNVQHLNEVSYYHPAGSSNYDGWELVKTNQITDEVNHLAVVPLKFRRIENFEIPELENSFSGIEQTERFLITNYEDTDVFLSSLDRIENKQGVFWKFRTFNKIAKYSDYIKTLSKKLILTIKGAERFDIILMTVAYAAMWYTLVKVFYDMRNHGSKFWLAFSTILSSTYAFLFALVTTTKLLGVRVPLISLTEGLPFLVAVIGFRHKVAVVQSVMSKSNNRSTINPINAATIISSAVYENASGLLKDSFIVIGAFLGCSIYATKLEGLRNFSILSSLILSFDLLMVFTFYSAILALKIEINMIRRTEDLKEVLEEDGISEVVATTVSASGNDLKNPAVFGKSAHDSSIFIFKMVMIAGFFGFHAFWLGTSWLYDLSSVDNKENLFNTSATALSKTIAKHIVVDKKVGTLVTILPPRTYMPFGFFVQSEDIVLFVLEKVSLAIQDPLISKFLLFAFAVSISTNVYFLNATRFQVQTTSQLIKEEIIPKVSHKSRKIKKTTIVSTGHDESIKESEITGSESEITEDTEISSGEEDRSLESAKILPLDDCVKIMKDGNAKELKNKEVVSLVVAGKLPLYALEKQLADNTRAVLVRRQAIAKLADAPVLDTLRLPYSGYDYDRVFGACCENVIGYMPIPVGVAGPMIIDGVPVHIPMATTEGCLVASTMRGCKAINAGGGVQTVLTQDGMTRGPCVTFRTLARAGACKMWLDSEEGQKIIKKAFNSTSRFARLQHIQTALAGTLLFIRFRTTTGDAMGMNMISKGVEYSLKYMVEDCGWNDMEIISLSGNYCTDKKPAAINWIEGRGKSVVAQARIPADVVKKVLKSDVDALVSLNVKKNLIGSAMAGSIGGFNAHAANLVTAVFLATGQDPAQNVESSNCITLMDNVDGDLEISVSMPSIEVGTIGGGTILEPQGAMLDFLGVRGPHATQPGENARQLARIVACAVLAAELSLCSALAAGHLVQSHMQHNRKGGAAAPAAPTPAPAPADIQRLTEGANICIKS